MRTRRAHPKTLKAASSGAAKFPDTGTVLASIVCVGALVALASACGEGGSGSGGSGPGSGGAGATGGGQGGDGLQDFVVSASSSGSGSGSGGGPDAGPVCPPPQTMVTTVLASAYGDAQGQTGLAVSVDKTGNILLAGSFRGTITLGATTLTSAGEDDAFVAKLSPTGQVLWAQKFGDARNQTATGIGADADGNIFVTGIFVGNVNFGGATLASNTNFFQDIFLVKFTPSGAHTWSQRFGGMDIDYARALGVDAAGNVVIGGYFQQMVDFGGGTLTSAGPKFDAFIAKFNPTGQHLFSKRYGDDAEQSARALTIDATGNIYLVGEASGTIDFGGGAMTATAAPSAFVTKLDPQGGQIWAKLSVGTAMSKASATSVAVSSSGTVAVAGQFLNAFDFGGKPITSNGIDDAYVTVLTSSGAQTFTRNFGDPTIQRADGVAFAPNGDVLLTGAFTGAVDLGGGPITSVDGFDMFFGRFDAQDGCLVGGRSYGGPLAQSPQSLVFDPTSGNVLITGSIGGTVDFGLGPVTAAGDDAFILSVKP